MKSLRILHISDTHGFHETFPNERFKDIDVVIHSGDCSNYRDPYRNEPEVRNFIAWYKSVPVKHKIFVAGNHDTSIERRMVTPSDFAQAGIIYLENASTTIEGIKFWGSPHTPTYGDWAFMKKREKINIVWQSIPDDTDVIIVHGPPKGVRDLSFDREHNLEMCGCSALMKRCLALKDSLKLVAFGHIHNMDGVDLNQGISLYSKSETVFSNAACVYDGKFDLGLTSFGNIITL
jgi:Icc-related predicted phosphoesterase